MNDQFIQQKAQTNSQTCK